MSLLCAEISHDLEPGGVRRRIEQRNVSINANSFRIKKCWTDGYLVEVGGGGGGGGNSYASLLLLRYHGIMKRCTPAPHVLEHIQDAA